MGLSGLATAWIWPLSTASLSVVRGLRPHRERQLLTSRQTFSPTAVRASSRWKELEQRRDGEARKGGPVSRAHSPLTPGPRDPSVDWPVRGETVTLPCPKALRPCPPDSGSFSLTGRAGEGSGYSWSNNLKLSFLLASVWWNKAATDRGLPWAPLQQHTGHHFVCVAFETQCIDYFQRINRTET